MQRSLLKKALPHVAAVLTFLILSCIYFAPQIEGKVVSQSDNLAYQATASEIKEYRNEKQDEILWTNTIFSGMPAYQIDVKTKGNLFRFFRDLSQLFIKRPIGYFFSAALCYYIMLIALGIGPWMSILASLGFAYTTNNLLLFEAGHNTKIMTLTFLAPVIAGIVLVFKNKYFLGGVLYSIFLAIAIYCGHYQMVYYLFLLLGIFGLIEILTSIKAREIVPLSKAVGILVIGTALAVGASASRLLGTSEYARDTMRGAPILEQNEKSSNSSSETEGLAWTYAMRWSNGVKDIIATLIPRAAGGGSQEKVNEKSNVYKDFRNRGINVPKNLRIPLYHGDQPFTSGPIYFGALFIFLFITGAFWVKGRLKLWLVIAVALSMLISMGNEFSVINKLLFDYFPMFNKFRAPSSMLGVTSLLIPLLGMLGLRELVNGNLEGNRFKKGLYYSVGLTLGFCILVAILGPSLMEFNNPIDQNYVRSGFSLDALISDRKMYLRIDAVRSAVIIAIAAVLLFAYQRQHIGRLLLLVLLAVLALFDLWGVGKRYVSEDQFQSKREADQYFQLTEADRKILQDDDPYYRVHDLTSDPWNTAYRAYWHNLIGGYHAAKLQRYQDIIDYYLSEGHQNVLNMLNAKYILFNVEDDQIRVQPNFGALGNAWFIEGIRLVNSAEEEIKALNDLDPAADVIIHRDFEGLVKGFDPVKSGEIKLTSYHPEHLVYESNANGDQLAVFSEVWYGHNKGWTAYIDGQPVTHFRANYILRALNVPSGKHKIEFRFHPNSYYTGAALGYTSSAILLILLAFAGYRGFFHYRVEESNASKDHNMSAKRFKRVGRKRKTKKK